MEEVAASHASRGSTHLQRLCQPRERGSSSNNQRDVSKLPTRRPCPSAPQRRYWNQTLIEPQAGSSSCTTSVPRSRVSLRAAASATTTAADAGALAAAGEGEVFRTALPSVSSSQALLSCSTDAPGHKRTLTYATTTIASSGSSSSKEQNEALHFPSTLQPVKGKPVVPPVLLQRASSLQLAHQEATGVQANNESLRCQRLGCNRVPTKERATDRQNLSTVSFSMDEEKQFCADQASAAPMGVALVDVSKDVSTQAPWQLLSPLTRADKIGKEHASLFVHREGHITHEGAEATVAEAPGRDGTAEKAPQPATVTYESLSMPCTHAHLSTPPCSVNLARPRTPESLRSAASSNDACGDLKHSILSHSSTLARLLQRHQQEGWRDELRSALQQDVDAWVQQVREEQQLMRAQLVFAQAKAAELTREVRMLRDNGQRRCASSPLPCKADSGACKNQEEEAATTSDQRDVGSMSSLATGDGDHEQEGKTQASKQGECVTDPPVYQLDMESYIHSLETHARALHDEKQQLQLRLDRRTSQLATAQRRYEQNYAMLLNEQAVLEADYQRATKDIEEVVGMLVVARAAEQAALRRLNEYELALEEAEQRVAAMEAAEQQRLRSDSHKAEDVDDDDDDDDGGETTIGVVAEVDMAADADAGSAHASAAKAVHVVPSPPPSLRPPSVSDSAYFSCVEMRETDGAPSATTRTTISASGTSFFSPSPPIAFSTGETARTPQCSESDKTVLSLVSPTRQTPWTPLQLRSAVGARSAEAGTDTSTSGVSRSLGRSGSQLLTAITFPSVAPFTLRRLAARRSTLPMLNGTHMSLPQNQPESSDECELLRFKCTLLELELQMKEKLHREEKEKWESAVLHAEGVRIVIGEVEARVRQASASSSKVKGLLHEMNRLWCTSAILEDECGSEGDDADAEAAHECAPLASIEEEEEKRHLHPRHSHQITDVTSGQLGQASSKTAVNSGGCRSSASASGGREFFGIERPRAH